MKKAIEYFNEMAVGKQTACRWISIIEKAQKEAYREAVKDYRINELIEYLNNEQLFLDMYEIDGILKKLKIGYKENGHRWLFYKQLKL